MNERNDRNLRNCQINHIDIDFAQTIRFLHGDTSSEIWSPSFAMKCARKLKTFAGGIGINNLFGATNASQP